MIRWRSTITAAIAAAAVLCVLLVASSRVARATEGDGAKGDGGPVAAAAGDRGTAAGDTLTLDEPPKPIRKVAPKYPDSARRRKQEGTVFVSALITTKGRTERLMVVPGKGVAPDLDQAALQAISQWTFEPAKKGGRPVEVTIVVPVAFRLH